MPTALNPNSTAPTPAVAAGLGAPRAGGAPAVRHVCPFCGSQNDSPQAACPRCTMENTPQTRKATKSRIGPWYVLQSRNPAAPGMKWETLVAFVRKGRVKPTSIVRGPTTHQLWRYASQVKGLSREFGACYSCAGPIDKAASICPRCNRLQEPPANPDTLLETPDGDGRGIHPVFKDLKPAGAAAADADIVVPALGGMPAGGVVGADVFGVDAQDAAADTAAAAAAATDRPGEPPVRSATDLPDEEEAVNPMLNVNDLAAAFRLNLPPGPGPDEGGGGGGQFGGFGGFGGGGGRRPDVPAILASDLPTFYPRRSVGRPLAVLAAVLLIGVGLWLWLDDISRRRAADWFGDAYAALRSTGQEAGVGAHRKQQPATRSDRRPEPARAPPPPAPPAANRRPPATNDSTGSGLSAALTPPPPSTGQSVPAGTPDPDATRAAVSDAVRAPDVASADTAPATTAADDPATAPAAPTDPAVAEADGGGFPFSAPAENPDADATALEPGDVDLAVLEDRARSLRSQAIDAENSGDYATAVTLYERIKKLPRAVWPGDVELKLRLARGHAR